MGKMRKEAISIIVGSDGPTSVFVAGKTGKQSVKMRIKNAGKPSTISQIPVVYKIAIKEVKTIAFLTRPYSFAP